jgi:hypothetical protein
MILGAYSRQRMSQRRSQTAKWALAAALVVGACGSATPARAAPCPPDPDRGPPTVFLKDRSANGDETPLADFKGPLPLLHIFEVSLVGSVENVSLQPPGGVPFRRDGTRTLIVAPTVAGPLAIAATWTEQRGNVTCEGSTTITLPIAPLTQRPRVRFTKFNATDRPLLEFTVRIARGQLAEVGLLTIRVKVGTRSFAPRGRVPALFTLPLAPLALDARPPRSGFLARRSARVRGFAIQGLSAFDEDNFEQIPVPLGGTGAQVKLSFDGTGRTVGGRYRRGVLARRGLVVEVVQGGRVLGRLSTGILCINPGNTVPRCRTPGYRTRS